LGTDSYPNPVGPEGRVILKIAADKVNARAGKDQRLTAHDDGPTNRPQE
jgi:hypothetical protein